MTAILWLACLGLFFWCGALSRRVTRGTCCGFGAGERDPLDDEQVRTLADSQRRMETELYDRITELEERLDFSERMLAQANERARAGNR